MQFIMNYRIDIHFIQNIQKHLMSFFSKNILSPLRENLLVHIFSYLSSCYKRVFKFFISFSRCFAKCLLQKEFLLLFIYYFICKYLKVQRTNDDVSNAFIYFSCVCKKSYYFILLSIYVWRV